MSAGVLEMCRISVLAKVTVCVEADAMCVLIIETFMHRCIQILRPYFPRIKEKKQVVALFAENIAMGNLIFEFEI